MGSWGYEEHQNDDFLDFIGNDFSSKHLLSLVNKTEAIEFVIGIVNLLPPQLRHLVHNYVIKDAIEYSKHLRKSYSEWNQQTISIDKQLNRLLNVHDRKYKLDEHVAKPHPFNYISLREVYWTKGIEEYAASMIQRAVREWFYSPIYKSGRSGFHCRKALNMLEDHRLFTHSLADI